MANNTGGFGLRTVTTIGNTPATSGQSNYKIESGLDVGIFKNNPVSLNDGGATAAETGFLQDMSFDVTDDGGTGGVDFNNTNTALSVGVFNGCFFINSSTSKPTFANSVAAGTTFGTDYNTAGDAKDGQSTVTLDIGGTAAETKLFRIVRSADQPGDNDLSLVNANVVVAYNAASNLYTA